MVIAVTSIVAMGCYMHPSVTIENASSHGLHGYVQIPAIGVYWGIGFPPRPRSSSRQAVDLSPGQKRHYTYKGGSEHAVQYSGHRVYVAFVRPDGNWYLATVTDWSDERSIRLEATLNAEGHPIVKADGPWDITERVMDNEALMKVLGEWREP